jgi:hypothetical protein
MDKQLLLAMLCVFSMLSNSAAVVAQSKDKKQEPKLTTQQAPEVPNAVFQIGESPQQPSLHISTPAPGQEDVAQVEFVHNGISFDGKVVKNKPYSADAVTETVQTLSSGDRVVQNSSAKIYRDSAGRTRREQTMKAVSGEAPIIISIYDPVSGDYYNLDSNTKTAHKIMLPPMPNLSGDMKAGAEFKDKPKLKATDGAKAGAVVAGNSISAGGKAVAWSGDAEVNQESLGAQTIEGVEAEGTRVTITVPAGKIDNENPIVTVDERWYSPELQAVVMSKQSDPRMGETTYRLTNIVRSEPDPFLFQVPADYRVEENGFDLRTGPPGTAGRVERFERARKPNDN